jgi:7-cyano-7-deazaguanine synthase
VSTTVPEELVVLASGGADSSILLVDQAARGRVVRPLYIRFGLAWEDVEEAYLRRFLDAVSGRWAIRPLTVFELPVADVYGSHWSVSGADVPDESTPDEAVYLPGRNLLLLAKTTVWCALQGVETIALGTLQANPFADSSPEFFSGFAAMAGLALGHRLQVVTPFASLSKAEVLERGRELPLEHTFSCVAPVGDKHCQTCNKCGERRKAFAAAGIEDRTAYAIR